VLRKAGKKETLRCLAKDSFLPPAPCPICRISPGVLLTCPKVTILEQKRTLTRPDKCGAAREASAVAVWLNYGPGKAELGARLGRIKAALAVLVLSWGGVAWLPAMVQSPKAGTDRSFEAATKIIIICVITVILFH